MSNSDTDPWWRTLVLPIDWVILVIALVVVAAVSMKGTTANALPGSEIVFVAEVDGKPVLTWNVGDVATVRFDTLQGPLGATVIETVDKTARVVESPCPRKWCIQDGELSAGSAILICAPNRLIVRRVTMSVPTTPDRLDVDAITQ
jgi:hypothetical protein